MQNSNNVVMFPFRETHKITTPQTIDEVYQNLNIIQNTHIDETIDFLYPIIMSNITLMGFDFDANETNYKDVTFLMESLRSVLCKHYGINHPFQQIADTVIEQDEKNQTLKIVPTIYISSTAAKKPAKKTVKKKEKID